jgi:hypothetical protein
MKLWVNFWKDKIDNLLAKLRKKRNLKFINERENITTDTREKQSIMIILWTIVYQQLG